MCRCGECFGCASPIAGITGPDWADVEVGEDEPRMNPAVKEWLEHLEQLLTTVIAIFRDEHRYTRTEDRLLAAQATYRDQMENL